MLRIHSPWLLMVGEIPLPVGPVPGKSFAGGTCISAYQYVVVTFRKVGQQVAALVVGHHGLDEARGSVFSFRDDPDACFGTTRSGDDATDIIGIDRNCLRGDLTLLHTGQRSHHDHGDSNRRELNIRSSGHWTSFGGLMLGTVNPQGTPLSTPR